MILEEDVQKAIILKYERKIFAFSLYLIGGDRDKAYELSVSSSADALKRLSARDPQERFLTDAAQIILVKARLMSFIPSHDDADFAKRSPEEKRILTLVRSAFEALPLEDKALLLARDQMNLGYQDVGRALGFSEDEARSRTIRARLQLRKEMEEVIRHER
jgi:DNA-directed RNA polymerase specialized sigma24 family protein